MFRTAIIRVARSAPRTARVTVSYRPFTANAARSIYTQHPAAQQALSAQELAKRAAIQEQDHLQKDWDAKVLSYEELLPRTQNPTADTFLIDVREPDEVVQGMIPSAVNVPLSILPESLHLNPQAFLEKFGFEKPRPTQEVIFYCRSGKRSTTASDVAKRNGYTNILNYTGSWLEWTEKQSPKPSA